jgi:hypothetical protein
MIKIFLVVLLFISTNLNADSNPYGIKNVVSFKKCNIYKSYNDQVKCFNGILGINEEKIKMKGGVCSDDPMSFVQTIDKNNRDFFNFGKECIAIYSDKDKKLFDSPPTSFSCRANSKLLIAGSTYAKIKDITSKYDPDDVQVPDRFYIYKCIKNCENKPNKILYRVGDCG